MCKRYRKKQEVLGICHICNSSKKIYTSDESRICRLCIREGWIVVNCSKSEIIYMNPKTKTRKTVKFKIE